jgi:two-component system response regulator MprA
VVTPTIVPEVLPAPKGPGAGTGHVHFAEVETAEAVETAEPVEAEATDAGLPSWADENVLRYGDLALDPRTRLVRRGARAVELSRLEFDLLALLLDHARMVLTREVIYDRVWGYGFGTTSNTLNVHVRSLRRKLEAGGEPRLIQTVHGVGYVLRD